MIIETPNHDEFVELLLKQNYLTGWSLSGETLVLWEHDEEPPAPLKRPKANETLTS